MGGGGWWDAKAFFATPSFLYLSSYSSRFFNVKFALCLHVPRVRMHGDGGK